MDKLKFDFTFNHLETSREFMTGQNMLLWIFHVDKIPPHVGISQQGIFFSLKSNGRDELLQDKLIQVIENKEIKGIVLNIKYNLNIDEIRNIFGAYECAYSSRISCLTPIKEVLDISGNVPKLSDLLVWLDTHEMLQGYHGFNVTESELGILKYEVSDIDERLNLLHA